MLSYSKDVNDCREEFQKYYIQYIEPVLIKFEGQRRVKYLQQVIAVIISFALIIGSILFLIIGGFYGVDLNLGYNRLIGPICFCFGMIGMVGVLKSTVLGDKFEKEVKQSVMVSFLKFFGDFSWSYGDKLPEEIIQKANLMGSFNRINSRDYFEGFYNNLKIIISKCRMYTGNGKNVTPIFTGLLVKIDFDQEINSKIDFKYLENIYKTNDIRTSFVANSLILAIQSENNIFKLADLRKPINDSKQMQKFFEEFFAVLYVVNQLM